MSSIRKDQQRPEGEDQDSSQDAAGAGPIDKSNVMKSFYQRALDERDGEIERLKADNQRLRAKIISGDAGSDDATGASVAGETVDGDQAQDARVDLASYRRNAEVKTQLLASLTEERDRLVAEAGDSKDRMLRALAELDNVRRRTEREKQDISKYAISEFARDVIGIGDTMQRAIDHVPAEAAASDAALKSFLEGVQLMERELLATLERHGVVRLSPLGDKFDPNRHQAVMEQETTEVPAGTVVQVLQAGFVIGERTLRPAVVAVSKGGPKAPRPTLKADDLLNWPEPKTADATNDVEHPAGAAAPASESPPDQH